MGSEMQNAPIMKIDTFYRRTMFLTLKICVLVFNESDASCWFNTIDIRKIIFSIPEKNRHEDIYGHVFLIGQILDLHAVGGYHQINISKTV